MRRGKQEKYLNKLDVNNKKINGIFFYFMLIFFLLISFYLVFFIPDFLHKNSQSSFFLWINELNLALSFFYPHDNLINKVVIAYFYFCYPVIGLVFLFLFSWITNKDISDQYWRSEENFKFMICGVIVVFIIIYVTYYMPPTEPPIWFRFFFINRFLFFVFLFIMQFFSIILVLPASVYICSFFVYIIRR